MRLKDSRIGSPAWSLLEAGSNLRAELLENLVFVREGASLELGVHQQPIDFELELAAGRRHERDAVEALLELANDFARQTEGLGFVVSSGAVGQLDLHDDSSRMGREAQALARASDERGADYTRLVTQLVADLVYPSA